MLEKHIDGNENTFHSVISQEIIFIADVFFLIWCKYGLLLLLTTPVKILAVKTVTHLSNLERR